MLCWGFLFALLVLPLSITMCRQDLSTFDADFVNFYTLGRIFNEYPHDRLYDADLQRSLDEQVHPLREGAYSPVAYPPAVAIVFQPLAALPYQTAYRIWLLATLALYVSGIVLLGRSLFPDQGALHSLLLCFALAYFPFVIETLMSGQLAAVAVFVLAMAIREDLNARPFACGLWLSVCAYKPTLLIWTLPMLLVTRRWRSLAGFAAGMGAFAALTTAVAGASSWHGYLVALMGFRAGPLRFFRVEHQPRFTISFWKYVDITSFTTLLTRCAPWIAMAVFVAATLLVAATLGRRWRYNQARELAWAAAISATLVVNLYTPIYDATLVVLGIMLTIAGTRMANENTRSEFLLLFLAIFCVSWVSASLAIATRVQCTTLLFMVLGILQCRTLGAHQEVLKPPGPILAQAFAKKHQYRFPAPS